MPADFDLQPFDPEAHGGLMFGPALKLLRAQWPWSSVPVWELRERMVRELAKPGTVAYVMSPRGMPHRLMGCIAARPHERVIVWAFVKYAYRRLGVATSAAEAIGVDFAPEGKPAPVGLVFWTYAAARIVARNCGYLLFHDTRSFDDDETSTRGVQGERVRSARDGEGDPSDGRGGARDAIEGGG